MGKPIVYSASTFEESPLTRALAYGVSKLMGSMPGFLNPNLDCGRVVKDAPLAVFMTARQPTKQTIDAYVAVGVPAVVADLGYLRRPSAADRYRSGYWQMSLGGLNWIPPFECPRDRLDALALPAAFEHPLDQSAPVIVLGQVCPDAQHGLTQAQHDAFVVESFSALTKAQVPAVYRPHPLSSAPVPAERIFAVCPHAIIQDEPGPLAKTLAGARAVVCWNSTAGLEALALGVPVFCRQDAAHYREIAHDLTKIAPLVGSTRAQGDSAGAKIFTASARAKTLTRPDRAQVEAFLARVAYAQWTMAEIETGEPFRFLLEAHSAINSARPDGGSADALGRTSAAEMTATPVVSSGRASAIFSRLRGRAQPGADSEGRLSRGRRRIAGAAIPRRRDDAAVTAFAADTAAE